MEQVQVFLMENAVWCVTAGILLILFLQICILLKIGKLKKQMRKEGTSSREVIGKLLSEKINYIEEEKRKETVQTVDWKETEQGLKAAEKPLPEDIIEEVLAEIFS